MTGETIDLLSCPFCGGNNIKGYTVSASTYAVECQDCFGSCGIHNTPERATTAWNRRHNAAAPSAWVPCGERLPEKERHVLLLMDYDRLAHGWYQGWNRGLDDKPVFRWHPIQQVRDEIYTEVTHWRPLPPTPDTTP